MQPQPAGLESDPRFPSGPWEGYFLQKQIPGKHQMELMLSFADSEMSGQGRDLVGAFTIEGRYDLVTGECTWRKQYVGKHFVFYRGFNEGRGIWGTWEIPASENQDMRFTGGFHIWPVGMAGADDEVLGEAIDVEETAYAPVR